MAEESGVKIDGGELMSILECNVCYTPYNEATITKCGHTYCKKCIEACIAKNHECPECKTPLTDKDLTRNIQIERLHRQITELQERAKKDPMHNLYGPDSGKFLKSPLVLTFQNNLKDCLGKFEIYCAGLKEEMEECKKKINTEFAMRLMKESQMHVDQAKFNLLNAEKVAVLAKVEQKYKATLESLMQSYDRYMKTIIPEPKIEAVKVVILAPQKGVRLENIHLKPYDTLKEAKGYIEKALDGLKNPVLKWGANIRFLVFSSRAVIGNPIEEGKYSSDDMMIVKDEMTPIYTIKIATGCKIVVDGTIICESDVGKPCISLTFKKEENKAFNYYSCDTCGINWVCEACAGQCHKGHQIKDYLKGHVPTWGCCYCMKKGCKIPNKNNPKEGLMLL